MRDEEQGAVKSGKVGKWGKLLIPHWKLLIQKGYPQGMFSNQQSWESKDEGREPSRLEVTRQIPRMRDPKGAAPLCGSKVPSIEDKNQQSAINNLRGQRSGGSNQQSSMNNQQLTPTAWD
jgi:hypothetical protein